MSQRLLLALVVAVALSIASAAQAAPPQNGSYAITLTTTAQAITLAPVNGATNRSYYRVVNPGAAGAASAWCTRAVTIIGTRRLVSGSHLQAWIEASTTAAEVLK